MATADFTFTDPTAASAAVSQNMTSAKFSTFLTQIASALREEKGPELAYLLKPTSDHGKQLVKEFKNPTVRTQPRACGPLLT